MTHRESKAISDRINRKAEDERRRKFMVLNLSLEELVFIEASDRREASRLMGDSDCYRKEIKRRKMEAKKLTGSCDDRRTRIADGPETGGHVEASPAVDGVRVDGSDGRRRSSDRT